MKLHLYRLTAYGRDGSVYVSQHAMGADAYAFAYPELLAHVERQVHAQFERQHGRLPAHGEWEVVEMHDDVLVCPHRATFKTGKGTYCAECGEAVTPR